MRYFLLVNHQPEGPYEPADLLARQGFDGWSMVCAEEEAINEAWKAAAQVPDFADRLAGRAAAPVEVATAAEGDAVAAVGVPQEASESGDADIADEATDPGRRVILIVEDDAELREILADGVRGDGFRVITALDGKDAEVKLSPFTPDLIVTDLMMPRQGGFEFVRALPALGYPQIPVIIATSMALDESTIASMRLEANIVEFLFKPITISTLLTLIHGRLGTKRLSPRQKQEMMKNDGWSSGV